MPHYTVDYSQSGQAVILSALITPDTPRVVVDIGAHDGVAGSNSRALLEQGWRGVLVEPMPSIFPRLRENSAKFSDVSVVMAACAEKSGRATMRIGTDGEEGQMSSLSKHSLLRGSLSERSVEVETIRLGDLFARENVPQDFGILLVDTEGYDYAVLCGLKEIKARPRILVTEEFAGTDRDKYRLLGQMDYLFTGAWGADSLWVAKWHTADISRLRFPLRRVSSAWQPAGKRAKGGQAWFDHVERGVATGWAWCDHPNLGDSEIILDLRRVDSEQRYLFAGWRFARPGVAAHFKMDRLLLSGYRVPVDAPAGGYHLRVIEQGPDWYAEHDVGLAVVPA